ncbi:efflux RND transporter periplasmic adaptor subunit [Treponema sp. J25]|uniref:efflux RND transporter periplasmic adaptor subunit n=1 Tax=Treponema sp. J25 TaxID=2094121 RepID=UPI00104CC1C4|nr:efflux RND transporter periplasmic adaptor subunit [Treponema sp. J25]TCW62314.1 hypothetical protein C5O22_02265 [Treponema sp. J25]
MKKKTPVFLILGCVIGAGILLWFFRGYQVGVSKKKQAYEFTTIRRGTIESTVSATGTLAVESSVDVLAQMSGRIEKVFVDYNSKVKKDQLLATINTDLLKLQRKSAQATVDKVQSQYNLQNLAVQNAKALYEKGLLSEYDYKSALSTLEVYRAELLSAQTSLEQIETQINQYAYITSPIDGIILSKNIDEGSSVTGGSSSSSTTLFTIAANLSRMQILAEVDELDISSIRVGQEVRFTVEAYPGVSFTGKVKEIRLEPKTSNNVVYYYVNILADNTSGKLLPGMTAQVTFIKEKKENVLVVPNGALRFSPTSLSEAERERALFIARLPATMSAEARKEALARYDEMVKNRASQNRPSSQGQGLTSLMGGVPRMPGVPGGGPGGPGMPGPGSTTGRRSQGASQGSATSGMSNGTEGPPGSEANFSVEGNTNGTTPAVRKPLWYLDESGNLAALIVQVGISDAQYTEVSGPSDLEGKQVILKVKAE